MDAEVSPIFTRSRQKSQSTEQSISPVFERSRENIQKNPEKEQQIMNSISKMESLKKESGLESSIRHISSHAARGAEGFLGGIGNFLSMMTPELYEDEQGMPYHSENKPKGYPSSKELHEITKEKTGSYLEPSSKTSEVTQEIASDIGEIFSVPGLSGLMKIFLPIGGQLTKQLIKSEGGSEGIQDIGKLAFTMMGSIAGIGNAQRVASNAFENATDAVKGVKFIAKPTEKAFKNIKNSEWFKTGSTPSKAPAMQEIERIEKRISNGIIDATEAIQLRKDINEARKQLGAFSLDKVVNKKQALSYLDIVDDALMQSFESYGKNINPKWLQDYKKANEAYRITQRSRQMSEFIERNAKPLKSQMANTLFHVGLGVGALKLPGIAAAAIPVAATSKFIQLANRMIKSPVLRQHYIDVVLQASKGNVHGLNKAMSDFDKAAKKYEYPLDKE